MYPAPSVKPFRILEVGKNILSACKGRVRYLFPTAVAYEFRNPGHRDSRQSLSYFTACDLKRWKRRNASNLFSLVCGQKTSLPGEIFSFLTVTCGSAWERTSSLSEVFPPHTSGFALFIPHCDSGKTHDSVFLCFPLTCPPGWADFCLVRERCTLGETCRGMCQVFPEVRSEESQRKLSLFLNTL